MEPNRIPSAPWNEEGRTQVILALFAALALMDQQYSDAAINRMLKRLEAYPVDHVLRALDKCEITCRRIYLVDIIENLPQKRRVAF